MSKRRHRKFTENSMARSNAEERLDAAKTIEAMDRESKEDFLKDRSHKRYEGRKRFVSRQKELVAVSGERNFEYDYEVKEKSNDRGR
ncbi:hypothetical protein ACVBEJ_09395 [Porticoccus sp. GXU_MW_L64]